MLIPGIEGAMDARIRSILPFRYSSAWHTHKIIITTSYTAIPLHIIIIRADTHPLWGNAICTLFMLTRTLWCNAMYTLSVLTRTLSGAMPSTWLVLEINPHLHLVVLLHNLMCLVFFGSLTLTL